MKCNKILILITVVFVFILNATCFANNADENKITNDFELSSYSSNNGEVQYGVYVKKDDENKLLLIKAINYSLPSNLYNYKDDIRLRITYLQENNEVIDCKVINYKTGEVIEDLSEENINKLFNIEYGKTINEKNWVDVIKLSELKENEIYKYTATSTIQFPKIENDIGKNCIIYIKEKDDKTYEKEINMYKEISVGSSSFSYNEYNLGESFCIMYKKVENDELLKLISKDEIIYLSNYNNGDELKYQFKKYIYNDTEKDITINFKDKIMGVEISDSFIMPKGEFYGFDLYSSGSATINYSDNVYDKENETTKDENKQTEQIKGDNTQVIEKLPQTEQIKGDNTQATEKLPQTGKSIIIISVILIVVIITAINYKKYSSLEKFE